MIRRKKKIQNEKCTQAILFARVSSKKQKDKGVSLDVQMETITKYCHDKGLDKEIKGLEDTKEKYKTIDNDTKDKIVKTFTIAGNISYIFQHASPSRQNELLKMLLKDCQLNGKRLEYTLRKPFDTLIKNHNIKEWSNIAIKTIEEIC